jgi:hypothetical protein
VEPIRYAEGDDEVRLGDYVMYRTVFFWSDWRPGRVAYVPGRSPPSPWRERDGLMWIGIAGDNGTQRGFPVDPTTFRIQETVRFQRRTDGPSPLASGENPNEDS